MVAPYTLLFYMILFKNQCPSSEQEKEFRMNVPYENGIGPTNKGIYAITFCRPEIAFSIKKLSRNMSNVGPLLELHWEGV